MKPLEIIYAKGTLWGRVPGIWFGDGAEMRAVNSEPSSGRGAEHGWEGTGVWSWMGLD